MRKLNKQDTPIVEGNNNGDGDGDLRQLLQLAIRGQQELAERLEELEGKKSDAAAAQLQMVNYLYDTKDEHLLELTRLPIHSVRPIAYGMMLESLFDPRVQSGEIPLSRVLKYFYFRGMRSVGGVHLGRGIRLAEQQAEAAEEEMEERNLGGGE